MWQDDFSSELERALASYADPIGVGEPSQMTARVLAAIEKNEKRKKCWEWTFIFVMPEFAFLLVAAIFLLPSAWHTERLTSQDLALSVTYTPQAQLPAEQAAAPVLQRAPALKAHKVEQARLPKLDVFPAPTPLTEQEKLLITFVQRSTVSTRLSITNKPNGIEPLHIAELKIPAIRSDISQSEQNQPSQ